MSKKQIEEQLNRMLKLVREKHASEENLQEIGKICFLYSVGRMSPLEVALRLWYLYQDKLDHIYFPEFQTFCDCCRKEVK